MRLGLSSAAAADADLDTLFAACARRGLDVLELRAEDAHGVSDAASALAAAVLASNHEVSIAAYRAATSVDTDALAGLAADLGAPVLLAAGSLDERVAAAHALEATGARALVEVHGPARDWLDTIRTANVDIAWQCDDATTEMAGDVRQTMHAIPERLRYVRLLGGGPETAVGDGRGIGALMAQLALARFAGPLIIAPSSTRYRVAWEAWLGRRGGWGCGSKADQQVVRLATTTQEAG